MIEEKAKGGVFLSILGYGYGNLKDSTLERLADKGNGHYAYVDDLKESRKVLVEEMSGTLVTIAKDVKIQVEFNPAKVQSYRLIGYENRMLRKEDFNNDKVDAGEIGAGHAVTALYEVVPAKAGEEGVEVANVGARGVVKTAPATQQVRRRTDRIVGPMDYPTGVAKPQVTIEVVSTNVPEIREKRVVLDASGKIKLDLLGEFEVMNLSADEIAQKIKSAAEKYYHNPDIRVKLTRFGAGEELLNLRLRYKQPDGDMSKLIEAPVVDKGLSYAKASEDFKFAAAVAQFGMILRGSPHKGTASFDGVLELGDEGKGKDEKGYRGEFLEMVKKARAIAR
jgi:hypothetical protein